jgi:hypothetical protein
MNHQNLLKILAISLYGISISWDPSFANTPTTTFTKPYSDRIASINTLIIPGKSVGAINRSTTYKGLVKIFGSQRLSAKKVYGAEGQVEFSGTLITLGKNRSLTVVWKDKTKQQILYVSIEDPAWKTAEGIGIGMSISKLRQIIGEFNIGGLGWDYGNSVIILAPAKQAKFGGLDIQVDADPTAAQKFPKDLAAVSGDMGGGPVSSPRWKRLKMSISAISVSFLDPSSPLK